MFPTDNSNNKNTTTPISNLLYMTPNTFYLYRRAPWTSFMLNCIGKGSEAVCSIFYDTKTSERELKTLVCSQSLQVAHETALDVAKAALF